MQATVLREISSNYCHQDSGNKDRKGGQGREKGGAIGFSGRVDSERQVRHIFKVTGFSLGNGEG